MEIQCKGTYKKEVGVCILAIRFTIHMATSDMDPQLFLAFYVKKKKKKKAGCVVLKETSIPKSWLASLCGFNSSGHADQNFVCTFNLSVHIYF